MTQRATRRQEGEVPSTTPLRDVMHRDPAIVDASTDLTDVGRLMADRDIGDVLVRHEDGRFGIVTDRDIVVRAVANAADLGLTPAGKVASDDIVCLQADDTVADAVELMRKRHVRRIPVLENGQPVGIISIGDLAVEREPDSALADISAAPPNR